MNKKTIRILTLGVATTIALSFSGIKAMEEELQSPIDQEKRELPEETFSKPKEEEKDKPEKWISVCFEDKKAHANFMGQLVTLKALEKEPCGLKALKFTKGSSNFLSYAIPVLAFAKGSLDIYRGKSVFNRAMLTGLGTTVASFLYGTKRNKKFGKRALENKIMERQKEYGQQKEQAKAELCDMVENFPEAEHDVKIGAAMKDVSFFHYLNSLPTLKGKTFEEYKAAVNEKIKPLKELCDEQDIDFDQFKQCTRPVCRGYLSHQKLNLKIMKEARKVRFAKTKEPELPEKKEEEEKKDEEIEEKNIEKE